MTPFNQDILYNWILLGYRFIICTHTVNGVNLHPFKNEINSVPEDSYVLKLSCEETMEMATDVMFLPDGFRFMVDISDME